MMFGLKSKRQQKVELVQRGEPGRSAIWLYFYLDGRFFKLELAGNPILILLWGIIVGYVFSTVGAAGAILTFIGQVVVFKFDKAMIKHLIGTGMEEAKAKAAASSTLKVHNLMAVILSPLIAVPRYLKDRRVAIPLALCIAVGVVAGAIIGPMIPMTLDQYKFWFGVITFLIGVRLFYETTETYRSEEASCRERV